MEIKNGLRPLLEDKRDIKLGAISAPIDISTIPDFFIEGGYANDQYQELDDCTAYATIGVCELEDNVKLDREFQFALSKSYSGDPDAFGQDLRTAASVPVKAGALPRINRPTEDEDKPLEFLRYLTNWARVSVLLSFCLLQRKKSYVWLNSFDEIVSNMWKFKDENRGVAFGVIWNWYQSTYIIDTIQDEGSGHALFARGFKRVNGIPYLVVQNSIPDAGQDGCHLFSKEVIDHNVGKYGSFMFVDYTPEEIKSLINKGLTVDSGFLDHIKAFFMQVIIGKMTQLITLLKQWKTS